VSQDLIRRHDHRVEAIIPDIEDIRILREKFGDLRFLKFVLLLKRMGRGVALRRQNLEFPLVFPFVKSRVTPAVVEAHLEPPALE